MAIIQERLKLLREARGLTAEKLADLAGGGMQASTISLLETGSRSNPHIDTLARLAGALNTTTDYLAGLTDDPSQPQQSLNHDAQLQRILAVWPMLLSDPTAKETIADLATLLAKKAQQGS